MLQDILAIIGVALVGFGCWQIYPPLAYIVVGVILLAVVAGSVRTFRHKGSRRSTAK